VVYIHIYTVVNGVVNDVGDLVRTVIVDSTVPHEAGRHFYCVYGLVIDVTYLSI
jgi:hypothetical protein